MSFYIIQSFSNLNLFILNGLLAEFFELKDSLKSDYFLEGLIAD